MDEHTRPKLPRRRPRYRGVADFLQRVRFADGELRTLDATQIQMDLLEEKILHRYQSDDVYEWFVLFDPVARGVEWFRECTTDDWHWDVSASRFVRRIP